MTSAANGVRKPANKRTGHTKGYRGQKGGAHQIAWQDDPIILDRIRAGLKPWMERRSPAECLEAVRAYMSETHPREPTVGLRTMYEDRDRATEMTSRDVSASRTEHLAELDHVIRSAWEAFHSSRDNGSSRGALLAAISRAIERKAKLDGSLDHGTTIAFGVVPVDQPAMEVDASPEFMAQVVLIAEDLRARRGLPEVVDVPQVSADGGCTEPPAVDWPHRDPDGIPIYRDAGF